MQDLDLNVDAPEKLPAILRAAADMFRESHGELQSAWQDQSAGRVWSEFAKILDAAADKADKAVHKYVCPPPLPGFLGSRSPATKNGR